MRKRTLNRFNVLRVTHCVVGISFCNWNYTGHNIIQLLPIREGNWVINQHKAKLLSEGKVEKEAAIETIAYRLGLCFSFMLPLIVKLIA